MIWLFIVSFRVFLKAYSLFVFPIAFFFKELVRNDYYFGSDIRRVLAFPLWITLNDSCRDLESNFVESFKQSWINQNCFNWNNYIVKRRHLLETVLYSYKSSPYGPLRIRRLIWSVKNQSIDQRLSWLGTAFVIYKCQRVRCQFSDTFPGVVVNHILTNKVDVQWRFSHAHIWFNLVMVEFSAGYDQLGNAIFNLKINRFKESYTDHWF